MNVFEEEQGPPDPPQDPPGTSEESEPRRNTFGPLYVDDGKIGIIGSGAMKRLSVPEARVVQLLFNADKRGIMLSDIEKCIAESLPQGASMPKSAARNLVRELREKISDLTDNRIVLSKLRGSDRGFYLRMD